MERAGKKMVRRKSWESWEGRREPVDDVVVPRYETGLSVCDRGWGLTESLHWCGVVPPRRVSKNGMR